MKWLEPAFSQRPSVLDHIVHQMVLPRTPHSIPKIHPTTRTHTHTSRLLVIVPANLGGKRAEKGGTMIWQKFGNTNTKSSNVTVVLPWLHPFPRAACARQCLKPGCFYQEPIDRWTMLLVGCGSDWRGWVRLAGGDGIVLQLTTVNSTRQRC